MKKTLFLVTVLSFVLFGCNHQINNNFEDEQKDDSEIIVLGKKKDNPFSIGSDRAVFSDGNVNYYYLRLRTDNIQNLQKLIDKYQSISTVPYDYEIQNGGCMYEENYGEKNFSPWFYMTVSLDDYNLLKNDYEIEILDEMYVPADYLESFYENEKVNFNCRLLWSNYCKVKPNGYVKVWDNSIGTYVPVPRIQVTISQWCFSESTYTDENGYYEFKSSFSTVFQNTANIKVSFNNDNESVYEAYSLIPAFYIQGDKKVENLRNNTIYLTNNTKQSEYGMILRASEAYRKIAHDVNVSDPGKLKIWRDANVEGAITLMSSEVILRSTVFTGAYIGTIVGGLPGIIVGSISGAALAAYFPDILIGTKSFQNIQSAEYIINTVFHEMSHASHYRSMGLGRADYWAKEYEEMLGGWLHLIKNGESPWNNCYNNGNSKLVCLIESWGYFFGDYATSYYYKQLIREGVTSRNLAIKYDNALQNGYTSLSYFYNNAFSYLMNNYSYTIATIFAPLKDSNVKTVKDYIDRLYRLNSRLTTSELKNIFNRCGARF